MGREKGERAPKKVLAGAINGQQDNFTLHLDGVGLYKKNTGIYIKCLDFNNFIKHLVLFSWVLVLHFKKYLPTVTVEKCHIYNSSYIIFFWGGVSPSGPPLKLSFKLFKMIRIY